jgi:uncharacterized peroxidase-related enzyme
MSFIETTSPGDAEGEVAAMYLRQQSSWGYVPGYAKVFCHRPEVLARWGRLLAEIKRPMDRRRFELVTFVAALELRNTACSLAHGNALRPFFDDEQIAAIAEGRVDGVLDAGEQAMVRYARQVARDASRVTPEQVAALREHGFADAEVFDIAATAAGRAFFTKMLDALGVEADSTSLGMDEELRNALTVGRPIGTAEPERMPDPEPMEAMG